MTNDVFSFAPWLILFLAFFVATISILGTAFWLWMIIDSVTRRFDDQLEKVLWIVAIVFGWLFAAIVYYFAIRVMNPCGILQRDLDQKMPAPPPPR